LVKVELSQAIQPFFLDGVNVILPNIIFVTNQ